MVVKDPSDLENFFLWHDRLSLGSVMMRRIIENFHGNSLQSKNIVLSKDLACVVTNVV